MAAPISSVADVVNLALERMGKKLRIGDIYEGSEASIAALTSYTQTKDALLRSGDWDFANRTMQMELLKSAPTTGYFPPNLWSGTTHPPPGWYYEYTYPVDCLRVRSISPTPLWAVNFDPQANSFKIANDNFYTPARRVILANVPNAFLNYVGQVGDPSTMDPLFIEALAADLARRLAPALANMEAAKLEAVDAQTSRKAASMEQG